MNVLIIKGSPHEKGTTSLLAKKFEEGARAAGHVVQEIDAAHMDIKSCLVITAGRITESASTMTIWRTHTRCSPTQMRSYL